MHRLIVNRDGGPLGCIINLTHATDEFLVILLVALTSAGWSVAVY